VELEGGPLRNSGHPRTLIGGSAKSTPVVADTLTIRRAIDHLRHVEAMLSDLMPEGRQPDPSRPALGTDNAVEVPEMAQDAVDQLFADAVASVRG